MHLIQLPTYNRVAGSGAETAMPQTYKPNPIVLRTSKTALARIAW